MLANGEELAWVSENSVTDEGDESRLWTAGFYVTEGYVLGITLKFSFLIYHFCLHVYVSLSAFVANE
jgi:hypothetical protein